MSRLIRVAAVALLVCVMLAATAAAHKHRRHGGSSPARQPLVHTDEDRELWALVTASLESRNYSRPAAPGMSGALGVDVPVLVTPETWSCLLENGYSFSIVRAWHSTCQVDTNGAITVANAWKAGVQHVDIYLFPSFDCPTNLTAAQQVDQTLAGMQGVPFGMLWFDIEQNPGSGWGTDADANHQWLVEGVAEAIKQIGVARVGIYTSPWGWVPMGSYADMNAYPLWWPNYDDQLNYDSFKPFAGWSKSDLVMKQFNYNTTVCELYTDVNWHP